MSTIPKQPKIYHITHINNLEGIISNKVIWSDAKRIEMGLGCEIIGMSEIKRRRLMELDVHCHPGTKVGQYVPFYFCPRSIMLYILYRGNHPDITYRGGQEPILHLQSDLMRVIQWSHENNVRWAFSDRNAGERIANFYKTPDKLDKVNWQAVAETDFRPMLVKEGKQAEFLIYESFPWELIEKIGVYNRTVSDKVIKKIGKSQADMVNIKQNWYY